MIEIERRKYDRYVAPEEAFVRLQLGVKSILGQTKNISRGGLFFEYINRENPEKDVEKGFAGEIDIFSLKGNFYLPRISCKIIHGSELVPTNPITTVLKRRCGMRFEELTQQEMDSLISLLEYFKTPY